MAVIAPTFQQASYSIDKDDMHRSGDRLTLEERHVHRQHIRDAHQAVREEFNRALIAEYATHFTPARQALLIQEAWDGVLNNGYSPMSSYSRVEEGFIALVGFADSFLASS